MTSKYVQIAIGWSISKVAIDIYLMHIISWTLHWFIAAYHELWKKEGKKKEERKKNKRTTNAQVTHIQVHN